MPTAKQLSDWARKVYDASQMDGDYTLANYLYAQAAAAFTMEGDRPSANFAMEMAEVCKE